MNQFVRDVRVAKFDVLELVVSNLFLQGQTIVQVCGGVDHYAIVCESGRVFVLGQNKHDHLGLTDVGVIVPEPTLVNVLSFIQVEQVACGRDFTLFLTDNGKLLGCGSNNHVHGVATGSGGPTPLKWTNEVCIKKITAGLGHALALTTSGIILSSGQNLAGQLGLNATTQPHFTAIDSRIFTDMSCGAYHSAILHSDGTVHTAGWNGNGQLGLSSIPNPKPKTFQQVLLPSEAASVACGFDHTVVLGTDGTVWAWGRNHCSQLGVSNRADRVVPNRVLGLEGYNVKKVIAGRQFTAFVAERGDVLVCGRQEGGEDSDLRVATLVGKFPDLIDKRVDCALSYSLKLMERTPKHETVKDAGDILTGLEKSIRTCLECPICFMTMSAPIRMCTEGHSVCDACRSRIEACPLCQKPFVATRNVAFESLVSDIQLPCEDCSTRMPVNQLGNHGDVCTSRLYDCPSVKSCGWRGRPEHVWLHATSTHPDDTWRAPHIFVHTNFDDVVETNVFAAHSEVFLLRRRYDQTAKVFRAAVQILASAKKIDDFKFRLDVISGDGGTNITFNKKICVDTETVESLFQSDSSVSVKRELLDMFLQGDKLVCEISVLKTDCCVRADIVKTLLGK